MKGSGKAPLRRDLNKVRDGGKRICVGKLFLDERTASAKALRSEPARSAAGMNEEDGVATRRE